MSFLEVKGNCRFFTNDRISNRSPHNYKLEIDPHFFLIQLISKLRMKLQEPK